MLRLPRVTRRLLILLAQLLAMALADEAPARAARAIGAASDSTAHVESLTSQWATVARGRTLSKLPNARGNRVGETIDEQRQRVRLF